MIDSSLIERRNLRLRPRTRTLRTCVEHIFPPALDACDALYARCLYWEAGGKGRGQSKAGRHHLRCLLFHHENAQLQVQLDPTAVDSSTRALLPGSATVAALAFPRVH